MSKKSTHFYNFNSSAGEVSIDLNNYTVKCSKTGNIKKFYHKYLGGMIQSKYNNCISTFEDTYVSRAGRSAEVPGKKAKELDNRIGRLYAQIRTLKAKRDELVEQSL